MNTKLAINKTYIVQSGDTLFSIAQKIYGDSNQWLKIYQVNQSVIGSNSTQLTTGMVLLLPKDLLQSDTRPVPLVLMEESVPELGTDDILCEVFFSKDYHDIEVDKVWKKVWQWACREEDIPEVGDHVVYDIVNLSVIIVRSNINEIKAFYNSCLHRGAQLSITDGNIPAFRCPFHGWTWKLNGRLTYIPCQWDFEYIDENAFRLPEVKLATWQGFVFINFDPNCEPLEAYLENIPEHFKNFPLENRYTAAHVAKVMPANWKVTLEAFMEAYHSLATHPQILKFTGDANSQYDVYGRHNRMITHFGVQSPHLRTQLDQQALAEALAAFEGANFAMVKVPQGMTARAYAAETARTRMQERLGFDCSNVSDTEMLDAISYFIFPNFMPWAGVGVPLQFRFRPNGNDPDSCIMDVLLLLPSQLEKRPPAAKIHWLTSEESWTNAPELGGLGEVFDQDTSNLRRVQKGLKTSVKPGITLGRYQESRIRHFHQVWEHYINNSC
ncbi:aromatic ring-hydroxylating dioxygenase subunit alpha [Nostoc sp. FACHB-133]|uniref:aromatic ring-hydroxylating dioxygenase subunit alpha n=1 Tax=Nostoc sp. FACHB-133 TaxID=2692835 RepID=UPI001684A23C|nr:aromatic ring-hydroxylating dioxygenase subunit alpha [Nostoc sp. FACHB-133]MBD2527703.1 Rieske 2Fe-2S domain-containing protein [Nostoc sp. FACHB-133]